MKIKKIFKVISIVALYLGLVGQVNALSYNELLNGSSQQNETSVNNSVYETGELVNDNGTIYFIYSNVKIPFTNFKAFLGLGYSLKNVVSGDLSTYTPATSYFITTADDAHPWGSWLINKGTVYYSTEEGLVPVPSWDVFLANKGKAKYIVPANKYDLEVLSSNPDLTLLEDNDDRVVKSEEEDNSSVTDVTTTPIVCNYPTAPAGYHYEGEDYTNLCGKYLVLDTGTFTSYSNSGNILVASGVLPTILIINPVKGNVGQEITLTGINFTSTGNTINFGSGVIPDVASESQGTKIKFTVPSDLTSACYFNKPSCLMPSQSVQPGSYSVIVTNLNGISNSINFEVVETTCSVSVMCTAPPEGYTYSGGGMCSCGTLVPSGK